MVERQRVLFFLYLVRNMEFKRSDKVWKTRHICFESFGALVGGTNSLLSAFLSFFPISCFPSPWLQQRDTFAISFKGEFLALVHRVHAKFS